MDPGVDSYDVTGFLAVNYSADYERLCSLDVLGLADSRSRDQEIVHHKFLGQITCDSQARWFETTCLGKVTILPFLTIFMLALSVFGQLSNVCETLVG